VDEIPFDFERRRMSVVVSEHPDVHQLICKGALQEILNVSTQVRYNGDIVPLDETMLRRIKRVTDNHEPSGAARGGGGEQIPACTRRRLSAYRRIRSDPRGLYRIPRSAERDHRACAESG
jgi:hypothetical protein